LADGETWYSKYQEGTVGKLTVTGTYTQTGGTLEIDLVGPDSYDVLTVGNFDVTQGDLKLNVSDSLARSLVGGERFSVFGANPSGILQFANIIPSFGNSFQWVLEEDGILTYYNSNQIPEPAAWLLLLTGAALVGFSRKFKVCKS
ncbi:MAG: PEP-CTERM sorting domain-containing protein, partial [Thermoguttaceae bacterium]|nr:PEP-CTERM sorting domain-containing protein [Thermoguttaceae bacterium]